MTPTSFDLFLNRPLSNVCRKGIILRSTLSNSDRSLISNPMKPIEQGATKCTVTALIAFLRLTITE